MSSALIGYTGFVGSTLLRERPFYVQYNSKNIHDIAGRQFDLLFCAAVHRRKNGRPTPSRRKTRPACAADASRYSSALPSG